MFVGKGLSKRVQSNVILQVCWFLVCSCGPGVIWAVVAIRRSDNLQQAEALVLSMLISPNGGVWGDLFSLCRTYNQDEMRISLKRVIPRQHAPNAYAAC